MRSPANATVFFRRPLPHAPWLAAHWHAPLPHGDQLADLGLWWGQFASANWAEVARINWVR